MATSEYGAYVAFAEQHADTDDAISVAIMRSKLVNNLNHIADECAQERVKYVSAIGKAGLEPIEAVAPYSQGVAYKLFHATFPVTVKPDGSSYVLRVRLAGHRKSSGQTGTATFEAVIGTEQDVQSRPSAQTVTATNTSATESTDWLTGDVTYITVPATSVRESWRSQCVTENSQDGTIDWALLHAVVWGSGTTGNGIIPVLRGFLVEEFIGL